MRMIMLDTNICIYILRDRPIELVHRLNSAGDISISSIVYAELLFGIELSPQKSQKTRLEQLKKFVQHLSIAPWDENAAIHYSQIRVKLKKTGTLIRNMDLLIGSHARSLELELVTNNIKEFERIPGLRIENWI
ncbi:MAG: type II toxin-antitoxin system VapC family toxin [Deltaproteobacteria bacterium]|nr:type II toxin-antitoxin system VapC family toxin [Deltaproteobacteria bacterium]MBT6504129.1 type II toxin-antitoxin system VapC family toxin [Deltaproteobacteria bacterium]